MKTLPLLFLCFIFTAATSYSQSERAAGLRGLRGMSVQIDLLDKSEEYGIEKMTLQSDVELQLRKAAIRIVNDSIVGETPGTGRLSVRINTLRACESRYATQIEVEFSEPATVIRTRGRVVAAIWTISRMITSGDNLRQRVRDTTVDILTIFAND